MTLTIKLTACASASMICAILMKPHWSVEWLIGTGIAFVVAAAISMRRWAA